MSAIYFDNIINSSEIETLVNEFNKKYNYPFRDSLNFQLGRSMVKHCSPADLINWKIRIRENQIVNDSDTDRRTIETLRIVNEFLRTMSHKAMDRITYYRDQEFDGKIFNNVRMLDYSAVITPEQFPKYRSILFHENNREIIMHYYFEFINWFPVTMSEFEKTFFLFLTFLAEDDYPFGYQMLESDKYIDGINEIVKMRYIDINDEFILSFLYILSIDKVLLKTSDTYYTEIKRNDNMRRDQIARMVG